MVANPQTVALHQTLRLQDGRRLGFADFGPEGRPVLYCHGWPSSRLEPLAFVHLARELGVRVIAADRPGYGLSDARPGRTLVDWAADVRELSEHLGLGRFGLLGLSGGGPYALACAARIPELVSGVALVCALGPTDVPGCTSGMVAVNRWLLALARHAPWLAEKVASASLRLIWGRGEQPIPKRLESNLPEADRRVLADPGLRQALTASTREALRGGPQGATADGLLYARPWEFDLADIRIPVHLWHGEQDVIVPPAMGHYLARNIPGCQAIFSQTDGHFSLPFGRLREALRVI